MAQNDRFRFRVWYERAKQYTIYAEANSAIVLSSLPSGAIGEQCTGLTDKNGKLVYEGDIIYSPRDGGTTKIIYFDDGLASFRAYNKDTDIRNGHQIGDGYLIELGFEVIGNIHENPYLIKD